MSALERPGNPLACPTCLSAEFIGENVKGWRQIKGARMVDGSMKIDRSRYDDGDLKHASFFCSNPDTDCDSYVDIPDGDLVQLDHEGKPVIPAPAEQQTIAGVA